MRSTSMLTAAFGTLPGAMTLWAQVQPPPAPWRGAGATPCIASHGGIIQCPQAAGMMAVRAGRLFNSNTGHGLNQLQANEMVQKGLFFDPTFVRYLEFVMNGGRVIRKDY